MLNLAFIDQKTIQLIFVLIISIVVWGLLQIFTGKLVDVISIGTPRGRRLRTLSNLLRTIFSILIIAFAIFESLGVLGINLTPLLASAGVVGLAIGFGSQALVKDVISGFFLLAEDQFDEGDEVQLADKRGVVKKISLRTVWLEEKDGTIHIVPNGIVTVVSNFSRKKPTVKPEKKLDKS